MSVDWVEFFAILCRHRPGSGARIQDAILADLDDGALNQLGKLFGMIPLPEGDANRRDWIASEWASTT